MNTANLRVAAIQHACSDDAAENLAVSIKGIRAAAAQGAQLIVLPELHRSRYFCHYQTTDYFNLAESIDGETVQTLAQLARETKTVIVTSIFEKRAIGLYHNTAVVLEQDGSIAGIYRKMHIPDDPGYNEKFYFTPGDLGFTPIKTSLGRLGVLVCWDQWYPEAARLMALAGAELLIYPTAIGWDPSDINLEHDRQLEAWTIVQRGHAVANNLPVIACNRVGLEPDPTGRTEGNQFWGHSFICGPQGEMLARADAQANVLIADIDTARCENLRRIWPYFRDRRIDAYQGLLSRYLD
ncbi:MAG: carbon-nitrogen hydrolase [Gammaproteobacteria bacterium]|nr:carbon-nitrogen hydrolase [Gammaproteobacteria bacterium]